MTAYDLLIELFPFFMIPVAFAILSRVFHIIINLAKGGYIPEMAEELIKEEEAKTTNIDEDMMKYFNYKEENNDS